MMDFVRTNLDRKAFDARLERSKGQFYESLTLNECAIGSSKIYRAVQSGGSKNLAYQKTFYNPLTGQLKLAADDKMNPIAEAYFYADMLLSNECNSIQIGEVYFHPNKAKGNHVTSYAGAIYDANTNVLGGITENELQAFINEECFDPEKGKVDPSMLIRYIDVDTFEADAEFLLKATE